MSAWSEPQPEPQPQPHDDEADPSWSDAGDDAELPAPLTAPEPGEVVDLGPGAGRCTLIRRVGKGSMAEVWLARHSAAAGSEGGRFEKDVALKRILPARLRDGRRVAARYRKAFLDEARLAALLTHPGIAQVHGLHPRGDGTYYLAMEYVPGRSLREVLAEARRKRCRLGAAFACHVASQLADALHYAFEARGPDGEQLRIVHRDLAPKNVMLGVNGDVKVLDFGIAFSLLADRDRTEDDVIKGTFNYMSPEQAAGAARLDVRSDLFALGIILSEMLTGRHPFDDDGQWETRTITRIMAAAPSDLAVATAGVPPALARIVVRALARRPQDRFQSGAQLADALRKYARDSRLLCGPAYVAAEIARLGALPEPARAAPQLEEGSAPRPAPAELRDGAVGHAWSRALWSALLEDRRGRWALASAAVCAAALLAWQVGRGGGDGRPDGPGAGVSSAWMQLAAPPPEGAWTPAGPAAAEPFVVQIPAAARARPRSRATAGLVPNAPRSQPDGQAAQRSSSLLATTGAAFATAAPPIAATAPVQALPRGTAVPALLVGPIDPARPGPVIAVVSANVGGGAGVVIPRGSHLGCAIRGAIRKTRVDVVCETLTVNTRDIPLEGVVVGADHMAGVPITASQIGSQSSAPQVKAQPDARRLAADSMAVDTGGTPGDATVGAAGSEGTRFLFFLHDTLGAL